VENGTRDREATVIDEGNRDAGRVSGRRPGAPMEPSALPPGRLLSEVYPERVGWLWPGRLPLGKLAVLDGDPGLGKSAITLDLAARVSAGSELPGGGRFGLAGVVLLSAEDGLADTIRPRLDAAGAHTERIVALSTVAEGGSEGGERTISITRDLDTVERAIARVEAALVVVDPLMAFLAEWTDSHKDQHVRRALAPLAALVERTRTAAVIVRHLSKGEGGNPLYRSGGSIGIIGAARSGLVVGADPYDPERRILASNKHNLSRVARSLVFRVGSAPNDSARVRWVGESNLSAADILKEPADRDKKSALLEAKAFLRVALKDGPVGSEQVKKDARGADISESTLKRAKREMGIASKKQADGSWSFVPPDAPAVEEPGVDSEGDRPTAAEPLDPLGKDAGRGGENPVYMSEEGQGDQGCQGGHETRCKHGYLGGAGCYLCDPQHPYRLKQGGAA
jgi:AAA domain